MILQFQNKNKNLLSETGSTKEKNISSCTLDQKNTSLFSRGSFIKVEKGNQKGGGHRRKLIRCKKRKREKRNEEEKKNPKFRFSFLKKLRVT